LTPIRINGALLEPTVRNLFIFGIHADFGEAYLAFGHALIVLVIIFSALLPAVNFQSHVNGLVVLIDDELVVVVAGDGLVLAGLAETGQDAVY